MALFAGKLLAILAALGGTGYAVYSSISSSSAQKGVTITELSWKDVDSVFEKIEKEFKSRFTGMPLLFEDCKALDTIWKYSKSTVLLKCGGGRYQLYYDKHKHNQDHEEVVRETVKVISLENSSASEEKAQKTDEQEFLKVFGL